MTRSVPEYHEDDDEVGEEDASPVWPWPWIWPEVVGGVFCLLIMLGLIGVGRLFITGQSDLLAVSIILFILLVSFVAGWNLFADIYRRT